MIVAEIMSDARSVLGKCDNDTVFRRITDSVRLANNQSKGNDWNIALMDLCVCDGCVTLPADVGTVLGINNAGYPTLIRDQWFQFHANGPGSLDCQPWNYTDELGQVCTFKDPSAPVRLVAVVENAADSNSELRVFGWDEDGKRIYTDNADGVPQDGFIVPTVYGFSIPSPAINTVITRIDRIQKQQTNGFVKLIAVDATTLASHTMIGYYLPWETVPSYRRIRVPDRDWVRIKYRRKDVEVRGEIDWINIDNREALLLLLKAVKFRLDNQIEQAKAYEMEGMRLLSNEAETLRPPATNNPQIIFNVFPAGENDTLYF